MHMQMKTWPASHGFAVFELHLSDIWMIDFYGGGGSVDIEMFLKAPAKNNRPSWPPAARPAVTHPDVTDSNRAARSTAPPVGVKAAEQAAVKAEPPPPWNQTAARARWLTCICYMHEHVAYAKGARTCRQ